MSGNWKTADEALRAIEAVIERPDPSDGDMAEVVELVTRMNEFDLWPLRDRLAARLRQVRSASRGAGSPSREERVLQRVLAELYAWEGNPAPLISILEREYLDEDASVVPLAVQLLNAMCPREALVYIEHAQAHRPEDKELQALRQAAQRQKDGATHDQRFSLCPPLSLVEEPDNPPQRPLLTQI